MKRASIQAAGSVAFITLSAFSANAVSVTRISADAFTPQAGLITFSEFATGTLNPTYTPTNYGGDILTAPTVTFGGFFQGQSLSLNPTVDCPGGAATGCVVGTPSATLSLDPSSPNTSIVSDAANPTSPVLSGSPIFNGPVTILFDKDIAGVGLEGGFFNNSNSTAITVFARDGSTLGQVSNTALGIEFLGLVTNDGSAAIAGLQFSLVGAEGAGFAIDNLRFGLPGQVQVVTTPEPASGLSLLTIGALIVGSKLKSKLT